MDDVTRLLGAMQQGLPDAQELLPVVYDELRRIAALRLAHEAPGHTLQATALVHEAWLRLGGDQQTQWKNRAHFFSAAGEAMRRILVDHARRKHSQKRGGAVPPEVLDEDRILLAAPPDELLAVHEALDRLAAEDADAASLVKLRYFVGMTMDEAAHALGMSKRSAEGLWTFARVWLRREIRANL
ncbi:MAG: RNA polymerase subunit sigma [Verrucomicrobiales bacterium]|nr:RNA polymerase subunit sigma [Verrucomicrobiales bacterium]